MVSEEPPENFLDFTKKWCTNLESPERNIRQNCLKEMLDFFETQKPVNVEEIYNEIYLHLIKSYSDRFEICRSLGASVVSSMLKGLSRNSKYLETLTQVIAKRLAQAEIIEESEELRLQLVTQMKDLIEKFKCEDKEDLILKSYNEIVDVLIRTLKDPFPAIQKESCEVILLLAKATPSFHYRAEVLVKPLCLMLFHRYSANRIAAIETLSVTALHIKTNDDCIGTIIMELSKLLMDSVPNVRKECGKAGIRLGLELRDRYSHFSKILPLILCCLTDDTEIVQQEILQGWIKVGQQYYEENEEELKMQALSDIKPEFYPADLVRPTLGCRELVQRNLRVVNVILHEMEDFKDEVRLHSARLLRQVVIHSEKVFATQLVDSYAVIAKTCNDPERIIATEAMIIALYLGAMLEYKAWGTHAREQLKKYPNLGNLKCFTAMYTAAANEKLKDLNEITNVLVDSTISHNQMTEYQAQLLELCNVLTEGLLCNQNENEITDAETERNLYVIVMKVKALTDDDKNDQLSQEIINKLATLTYASEFNLHQRHLQHLLNNQIEGLDIETPELSEPVVLLSGIVKICGLNLQNLSLFQPKLIEAITHGSPDSQITLFAAVAEAMLGFKDSPGLHESEDQNEEEIIKNFISEVISPKLIWGAGRGAETIRTMATAALCATAHGISPKTSSSLFANLTNEILPLIEDNAVKTRFNALRTLLVVEKVENSKLKPMIFMILSRLDDSSQDIRELAAKLLGKLEPETTADDWEETINQVVERMILHLESPEQKLREQLIESLKILKEKYPEVYKNQIKAIPDSHSLKKLLVD